VHDVLGHQLAVLPGSTTEVLDHGEPSTESSPCPAPKNRDQHSVRRSGEGERLPQGAGHTDSVVCAPRGW
jgi:hypothetical protein